MKKILLNAIALLFMAAMIISCTPEEVVPANQINSANGLKISLDWTTGSTSSQALVDTDLDLYLMKGTTEIAESFSPSNFEDVALASHNADGSYTVAVEAYGVTKRTDFTVSITDAEGGQQKTFTGSFEVDQEDEVREVVTIIKSGNTYTVTSL